MGDVVFDGGDQFDYIAKNSTATTVRGKIANAGLWNPPLQDGEQTPPTHPGALTATN